MFKRVQTIDCDYTDRPEIAAAYLIEDAGEVAFIETNTAHSVPRLLAQLEAAGRSPEDVRYIIITHIHLDHAGGAGHLMKACPNATLLAHPKAAMHAIDPSRIVAGARKVYGSLFDLLYGDVLPVSEDRVQSMNDGESVTLGSRTLTMLHTRGHANHHFVVHDPDASAVFTGDSFGVAYPALQRNGPFALPSTTPTDFDAIAARESLTRILDLQAERVFPTHFGEHRATQALAAQLDQALQLYQDIVDEADRSVDDGELDAFCVGKVDTWLRAELTAYGLNDPADYELARFDGLLNGQGLAFAVRKLRYKRSLA